MISYARMNNIDDSSHEEMLEHVALEAQNGNAQAFERLLFRFRPRLRMLVRRYYGIGANREDFAQEASIGFFKAVRDFQPNKSAFTTFVDLCVQRQLIGFIKGINRKKHIHFNETCSLDAPISTSEEMLTLKDQLGVPPSFHWIEQDAQQAFLMLLISRCTTLEQKVLYEYGKGYSYLELANRFQISPKSVDNALQRAKCKAKKLLEEQPHFVDDFSKVLVSWKHQQSTQSKSKHRTKKPRKRCLTS